MTRVALFIPCFVDQLIPQIGIDMAVVLRRIGCEVAFPSEQTCCGQPAFNTGYWNDARPLARRLVEIFRSEDAVICPSASCATMVFVFYPELLRDSTFRKETAKLATKVFEFSEFLVKPGHTAEVDAVFPHKVTYHDACHALRELRSVGLSDINVPGTGCSSLDY